MTRKELHLRAHSLLCLFLFSNCSRLVRSYTLYSLKPYAVLLSPRRYRGL